MRNRRSVGACDYMGLELFVKATRRSCQSFFLRRVVCVLCWGVLFTRGRACASRAGAGARRVGVRAGARRGRVWGCDTPEGCGACARGVWGVAFEYEY
jgi:hypothetical protein